MTDDLKEEIKKRFTRLQTKRERYEASIIEALEFCLPRRSNWDIDSETAPPIPKVFNNHASYALKVCAQGLESCIVSRTKPWFSIECELADDTELDTIPGALDWLENISRRMHRKLGESSFYAANSEALPDGCSAGTAYLYSEMDIVTKKMKYVAIHPREMFIDEDAFGEVDTVFRRFNLTVRQVMQLFPEYKTPEMENLKRQNIDGVCKMLHACFPREDRKEGSVLATDMPIASVFINLTTDQIVHEGGYNELPYHVWRYAKNSDEVYGRSPAIDAMVDIKMSQHASRTRLNLANMVSDPPWAVSTMMKGEERLTPRGVNYVPPDAKAPQPIAVGANYPINSDVIAELNSAIDDHFNVKFFLMISMQERQMTAYEAAERKGEQATMIGASIGRYENEFIAKCIKRTFNLMERAGEIPPAPEGLAEHGAMLNIRYCGYLAQLQARFYQSSGIAESVQLFGALAQLAPAALDNYDFDEFAREATDGYGLSQKTKKEQYDVLKLRTERAQAQQQQIQQQNAMAVAQSAMQNADKLNKQVQPGTPLAALAGSQ